MTRVTSFLKQHTTLLEYPAIDVILFSNNEPLVVIAIKGDERIEGQFVKGVSSSTGCLLTIESGGEEIEITVHELDRIEFKTADSGTTHYSIQLPRV